MKKHRLIPVALLFAASFTFISSMVPEPKNSVTVQKINGIPVYIMCEPEQPYQVVDYYSNDAMVTMSCPNIDAQVEYYINRAIKSKTGFDAILYTSGKKAQAIKFK